jgi:hypothetical protein
VALDLGRIALHAGSIRQKKSVHFMARNKQRREETSVPQSPPNDTLQ